MNKLNIFILSFLFSCLHVFGQERHGGVPFMFRTLRSTTALSIEKKEYPAIDNEYEKLMADSIALQEGFEKNKFYGIGVPVNLDFKQAATIINIGDTGKVYFLELSSPTAYALQVYFDVFKIPCGSRMFVYDSNHSMFLGSFTHENNFANNRFGTEYIKGNSLIIEYYEPNEAEFEAQLHIENLVHCFREVKAGPFSASSGSASCNINATCPLGYGWDREKRSIALILGAWNRSNGDYNYYGWCSGAVVNNTAQNGKPFFLTANHCLGAPMNHTYDWIFLFNHETQNCSDDGSGLSSYLGQSVYGASVLNKDAACSPTTDYLLLELNVSATTLSAYGVVYAGWETDEYKAANSPYTVGIHHPSGDVKKISINTNNPVSVNHPNIVGCPNSGLQGTHWQVSWEHGVTEGGSSGSPLFNSDHKIIGQLHGGSSSCINPQAPDFYGKFSKSFSEGGLSFWLDPYHSWATSIGTYNPSGINENCYNGIQDGSETGVDCGGNCPPCGWSSPIGGGTPAAKCFNGIKDNGETGIDCGGWCRPCGGEIMCNNCKKDGDETGIDCGGSCRPCNSGCFSTDFTINKFTNILATNPMSVSNNLKVSGIKINNGQNITYRAGNEIRLNADFGATSGCTFHAVISSCECKQPCAVLAPNAFTPNGDGINDNLCFIVSGYNIYEITVFNRQGKEIYNSSGTFSGSEVCVWNGSGAKTGVYWVMITFGSTCSGASKQLKLDVSVVKSAHATIEDLDYSENIETDIEPQNLPEEIKIYPNPASDFITIEYPHTNNPLLYIISETGKIVYVNKKLSNGSTSINMRNFIQGVYIVRIIDNENIFVRKIIKN